MDEASYWRSLRFRINSLSSDSLSQQPILPDWCDWFEPKTYILDGPTPRITGRVGFVGGRDAWEKRFVLLLGRPFGSSSKIEWDKLLPPEESDGWLSWDENGQVFLIDPFGSKGSIGETGVAVSGT